MVAPIVDSDWLQEHLDEVIICDVRYYSDGRAGSVEFRRSRIPGARYVDMNTVLAAPAGPVVGRHPLPPAEEFAQSLSELGVGPDDTVVCYDDEYGYMAPRMVWMLRVLGVESALLNGGLGRWGGGFESGEAAPVTPVDCSLGDWPATETVDADDVAAIIKAGGLVFDSRSSDRYRGENEHLDPRAGHIPGAVSLPFTDNYDEDGQEIMSTDRLLERFIEAGVDADSVFYCGSGVTACNNILAAEATGLGRPRLYVGSWSGWCTDETRPGATGPNA